MAIQGDYYVTPHALDRYQEHYPDTGYPNLLNDVKNSIEIDPELARTLVGRFHGGDKYGNSTRYHLSKERTGLFALVDDPIGAHPIVVVTYLRLGDAQHEFALKHWPIRKTCLEVTADEPPLQEVRINHPDLGVFVEMVRVLQNLRQAFGSAGKARNALRNVRAEEPRVPGGPFLFMLQTSSGEFIKVKVESNGWRYFAGIEGDEFPEHGKWT